jgi:hypothetical protein
VCVNDLSCICRGKPPTRDRSTLITKLFDPLSRSFSSHFFEHNRLKLCTTLGTVGCVAGKPPRRLHFFRHRTKLIEVLTRKTQQHRDLLGFACSWVFRKQVVKLIEGPCCSAPTCPLLFASTIEGDNRRESAASEEAPPLLLRIRTN